MAQSNKPLSSMDPGQTLQQGYTNQATFSVSGFPNAKVGNKITKTDVDSVTEDYRFLEVVVSTTGDVANTSKEITDVAQAHLVSAGMYVFGAGIPANTTVVSISGSTVTISATATADHTATSLKFTTLLCRLRLIYADSSKEDLVDIERLD